MVTCFWPACHLVTWLHTVAFGPHNCQSLKRFSPHLVTLLFDVASAEPVCAAGTMPARTLLQTRPFKDSWIHCRRQCVATELKSFTQSLRHPLQVSILQLPRKPNAARRRGNALDSLMSSLSCPSALHLCSHGTALRRRNAAQSAALTVVMRERKAQRRARALREQTNKEVVQLAKSLSCSARGRQGAGNKSKSDSSTLSLVIHGGAGGRCPSIRACGAQARAMQVDCKTIRNCLTLMTGITLRSSRKLLDRMAEAARL